MKKTTIGGSALLEGLMMIGPNNAAIAIRKPDGGIHLENRKLPVRGKWSKVPVLRGVVSFFSQMLLSTKAMLFSAEFVDLESGEGETAKAVKQSFMDRLLERLFRDRLKDAVILGSLVLSLAFSIVLFILLPNILAGLLPFDRESAGGVLLYNLFEGLIKVAIFLGYLAAASRMKDIRRVWQYHGAEHKTINCYENEEELTVENVMKHTTKNPRCSTSYLFLVILVSILVFSVLGWYNVWINVLVRLLLLPLVAGLSFELFRFASGNGSLPARWIGKPGLWLQILTTKEPDEQQVEVAILAFNNVRPQEQPVITGNIPVPDVT